jgi:hypothetical protein
MKKYCIFPDQSKFPIHSILDVFENQSCIAYYDEDIVQILWVPNEFVVAE